MLYLFDIFFGVLIMKSLILAAVAALVVFALPVQAEDKPADSATATATSMSAEDCKKALAACKDQACRDELASKGCVAE